MSNRAIRQRRSRVIFFGMQSNFSMLALTALLENEIDVCAVVYPALPLPGHKPPVIQRKELSRPPHPTRVLPLLNTTLQPSMLQLAASRFIPIWEVQRLSHNEVIATLAAYQPDIICIACFFLRIPRSILKLPRLGCLNVHPSLLPANRGPVPLFWTFREGEETTGVTIHFLDEGIDTGDILAQEPLHIPDGISYVQLESQCAQLGGTLLARSIWELNEGKATRTPQEETKSSYHSFPTSQDFVVYAHTWSARHVYNVIRGVGRWDKPIELHTDGKSFLVHDAISYSNYGSMREHSNAERYEKDDGSWVRCRDGWVQYTG